MPKRKRHFKKSSGSNKREKGEKDLTAGDDENPSNSGSSSGSSSDSGSSRSRSRSSSGSSSSKSSRLRSRSSSASGSRFSSPASSASSDGDEPEYSPSKDGPKGRGRPKSKKIHHRSLAYRMNIENNKKADDDVASDSGKGSTTGSGPPKDDDYDVDEILNRKKVGGIMFYHVKWSGYPTPTWEPDENLVGCQDAIRKYLKKNFPEDVAAFDKVMTLLSKNDGKRPGRKPRTSTATVSKETGASPLKDSTNSATPSGRPSRASRGSKIADLDDSPIAYTDDNSYPVRNNKSSKSKTALLTAKLTRQAAKRLNSKSAASKGHKSRSEKTSSVKKELKSESPETGKKSVSSPSSPKRRTKDIINERYAAKRASQSSITKYMNKSIDGGNDLSDKTKEKKVIKMEAELNAKSVAFKKKKDDDEEEDIVEVNPTPSPAPSLVDLDESGSDNGTDDEEEVASPVRRMSTNSGAAATSPVIADSDTMPITILVNMRKNNMTKDQKFVQKKIDELMQYGLQARVFK